MNPKFTAVFIWPPNTTYYCPVELNASDIISESRRGNYDGYDIGTNARRKKTLKSVFNNIPKGESSFGIPRNGWLNDIENDLKKIGVRGWRKIPRDRDAWELILKEAKGLRGP